MIATAAFMSAAQAQTITWGSATANTGDAELIDGDNDPGAVEFDAILPDLNSTSAITVGSALGGLTFNPVTNTGGTAGANVPTSNSDGKISFSVTNDSQGTGQLNFGFNSYPTSAPSSADFAALMNSGGTYEDGGDGAGIVSISGLTIGDSYDVQIFDRADDGDAGATTYTSGSSSVTLTDGAGTGGNGVGDFVTGSFTATSGTETFNWAGAGSQFTVLGAVSVTNVTAVPEPSTFALMLGGCAGLVFLVFRRRQNRLG